MKDSPDLRKLIAWPVALKLKKMAYVSITTPSKLLVLRAKNSYVALKLKKMAYVLLNMKWNGQAISSNATTSFREEWMYSSFLATAERSVQRSQPRSRSRWLFTFQRSKAVRSKSLNEERVFVSGPNPVHIGLHVHIVVVIFGVVGLRRVDEGQSGSPEMSSMACSSEIKEDFLRFILRRNDERQPFKVAGFESKEWLRSSEIKEDGLRFVLRGSEELYLNIYWILNIIWIYNIYFFWYIYFFDSKQSLLAWKLKEFRWPHVTDLRLITWWIKCEFFIML